MRWALAVSLSLFAHGVAAICAFTLFDSGQARLTPVFREGESSVVVTLETDGGDGAPEPAVEPPPPPPPVPIPKAVEAVDTPSREARPPVTVSAFDSPVDPPDAGMVVAEIRKKPAAPARGGEPGPIGNAEPKGVISPFIGLDEIRPHYPLGARVRGEEGVVTVRATVNARGRAEKVEVAKSSGFDDLDRAAREAVRGARFVEKGGGPTKGGEVVLSFRFKLVN